MKVFISNDMEGATGVVHRDQLVPEGRAFEAARKLLTRDVNAAIKGVLDVDPEADILVNDGHGIMRNVLLEDLDEHASLVVGPARYKSMCQTDGLDETFDAVMFVAYHSRVGTPGGLLSHTISGGQVAEIKLNGRVLGESGLNGAVAGHYGVPVVLATGAQDLVDEVREDLGDGVATVAVKRALGVNVAVCLPPARTEALIRKAAAKGLRECAQIPPVKYTDGPYRIKVRMRRAEMAQEAARVPGVQRVAPDVFATEAETVPGAYTLMWQGLVASMLEPPTWLA